jgi:hypothetical protein
MNPRLFVALRGDLEKIMKQEVGAAERAVTLGIRETTDHLKTELRDQVTGAGLGKKLSLTWRGKTFPKGRMSLNAAGFIWSNAPQIITAFDTGAVIRSHTGAYLPVPLPAAGKLAGRKKLTPQNWEQHNKQKLVFGEAHRRKQPDPHCRKHAGAKRKTRWVHEGQNEQRPNDRADVRSYPTSLLEKAPRCEKRRGEVEQ